MQLHIKWVLGKSPHIDCSVWMHKSMPQMELHWFLVLLNSYNRMGYICFEYKILSIFFAIRPFYVNLGDKGKRKQWMWIRLSYLQL